MLAITWPAVAGIGAVLVLIGIWVGTVIANLRKIEEEVREFKEAAVKLRDGSRYERMPFEFIELGRKATRA